MASVLFIALVVAVTGFEALLADVEAIRQPDATPYLGPAMVVGSAVVVFLATAMGAREGNPGITGLVAAAMTYLVMLGVGGSATRSSTVTRLSCSCSRPATPSARSWWVRWWSRW